MTSAATPERELTILWPANTHVPMIHDKYRRLSSGEWEARYTHEELELCVGMMGQLLG
jgi:hypothetical protein